MAETLGFMLPGSATAPAVSSDRWRFAEATGKRAAEMAKTGGPRPSELLTKSALKNASVVLQATSGSTNAIVHLAAIAGRAGITYDLQELDRVGRDVPVLLDLKPAGNNFMEDFHAGGSLPSLWRRLKDHLDLNAKTVNGETIGEIIARWPAYVDDNDHPAARQPAGEERSHRDFDRQPCSGRRRHQARRGYARAVPARGAGARLRIRLRTWNDASTIRTSTSRRKP